MRFESDSFVDLNILLVFVHVEMGILKWIFAENDHHIDLWLDSTLSASANISWFIFNIELCADDERNCAHTHFNKNGEAKEKNIYFIKY